MAADTARAALEEKNRQRAEKFERSLKEKRKGSLKDNLKSGTVALGNHVEREVKKPPGQVLSEKEQAARNIYERNLRALKKPFIRAVPLHAVSVLQLKQFLVQYR